MTLKKFSYLAFNAVLFIAFILLIEFALINFMLGCNTWDETLWTEYNSCVTPAQLFGL
jgi:uncharacterized membrane protein (DUF2068 family)